VFGRWRRRRFEQEMNEELRAHIEHRADDLVSGGMARADAVRQARLELGAIESHKEAIRDERVLGRTRRLIEQTRSDLRHAARRLRRAPVYAAFAIASIGIGAGMTTAMFAVMQAFFSPDTGVRDASAVVVVANQISTSPEWDRAMSEADFAEFQRAQTSYSAVVAAAKFWRPLTLPAGTQLVPGEGVTDGYFQMLGVEAEVGRVLQPADGRLDAPAVMVLSHLLWQRAFASDPTVVGKVVRFGGVPFEVVGVAARSYRGLNARMPRMTSVWIPAAALARIRASAPEGPPPRTRLTLAVAGRLRPEASSSRAGSEAATISAALDAAFPVTDLRWVDQETVQVPSTRQWLVRPVDATVETQGTAQAVLLAIVGLVLLVACTNLANLSLARGASREGELAVRLALGASRGRLIRELSAESVVVGTGGFVVATLVSTALMSLVHVDLPVFNGQTLPLDPQLTWQALGAAALAVGLALLVCGLWPAWRLSRRDVRSAMSTGAAGASPSWRTERILIRVQMVVSVALFCGAAGFISVLVAQARLDPGIALDRITVANTIFRVPSWDEARGRQAIDAISDIAPARFGFTTVALSSSVPFGSTATSAHVAAAPGAEPHTMTMMAATPPIFETLGIPLVGGRAFDRRDVAGATPVVVISESAARILFGSTAVVGREVPFRGAYNALDSTRVETRTVIGVTKDTDVGSLTKRGEGLVFVPLAQRYEPPSFVIGRTDTGGSGDLRALLRTADPDLAVNAVGSGLTLLAGKWVGARVLAGAALGMGGVTLVLTMAGLFGVLSGLVTRRSREIGIRKAMGADERVIRRMILRDGARPVVSGTVIGLALGFGAGVLIQAAFPSNAPPMTLVAVALVTCAVVPATLAACYFPARRAMRVDPNITLKDV
jgi:predicted permease